jgi:hypothetical protein
LHRENIKKGDGHRQEGHIIHPSGLAGTGVQRPLVGANPGIPEQRAPFAAPNSAKLVRLSIQYGVERIFIPRINYPTN